MPDELNQEEKKGFKLALRVLSRKSRTCREVAVALERKGLSGAAISKSIAMLEELGYLNDQHYAYNYAVLKASEKLWGSGRISAELRKKGLSEEIVDSALDRLWNEMSEEEILERALKKKIASMKHVSGEKDRRRLYGYLSRRGFPVHLIVEKMKDLKITVPYET